MASKRKRESVNQEYLLKLGKHIAALRHSQKISQGQLAGNSELTLSQIARIETGAINTTINTVFLICKGLNMTPEEFFKGLEL